MATEIVKSVCGLCNGNCGVLITLEDGRPVMIKGDPESPLNRGGLCKIGRASLEYLNHPDRLKHPLKRAGERGDGRWERISWDEALSLVSSELNRAKEAHGPESVVMMHGSAKGAMDTHLVRLANAFGTPNVVCSDHVCHVPRMLAAEMTFGFLPAPEYDHPPECIVVWGANIAATRSNIYRGFASAVSRGAKVISIDPLQTGIAKRADIWLQLRPGTDLALALGMLHVIIREELYDKEFVNKWTVGFEKLRKHVQDYTPEKVAQITWVPPELIRTAARFYAGHSPAHIEWGNAIDHQTNSFQAGRAISMLMALTGNLGIPGGEKEILGSGFRDADPDKASSQIGLRGRWSFELELRHNLSAEDRNRKVDPDLLPDFRYATPQSVVKAILEEDPYPVRAVFVTASNPLSSWPNLRKTYQAFKKLDFLAVSDMFMTPTAALADVVFPVASYLEFDGVQMPPMGNLAQMQRKVAQVGECRADHEIINGLAKRLGLGEHFWDQIDDFWNAVLEPAGMTLEDFRTMGRFTGGKKEKRYKKYEEEGFKTPSGKVELYSSQLETLGFEPLPVYHEPPESPDSAPETAKEYPLLCTTWKLSVYRHSGGRQIPSLRRLHPEPLVIIHPETARKGGIGQGDWVFIETRRGRIKQKANLSAAVDPRVVVADHAWWFPEKEEKGLFGYDEANYNVLTSDQPPFSREVGSFTIRGVACRVYKHSP
ncbi:MAG: molybdopterin-dependent oxidoreductase [Deltaproteobacteria bacterium]